MRRDWGGIGVGCVRLDKCVSGVSGVRVTVNERGEQVG